MVGSQYLFKVHALTYIPAAGFTLDKMLHTTPDDALDINMKIHD